MNWHEAFQRAGEDKKRTISVDLDPAKFAAALKALADGHQGLERSDPRYQAACEKGQLTLYDELGRSVVLFRVTPLPVK